MFHSISLPDADRISYGIQIIKIGTRKNMKTMVPSKDKIVSEVLVFI